MVAAVKKQEATMDNDTIAKLSKAVADCRTIIIRMDGDTGKITIKIGQTIIKRYPDIESAVGDLIDPDLIKEIV